MVIGSWTKSGDELDVVNMSGKNVSRVGTGNYNSPLWDITYGYAFYNRRFFGTTTSWPDVTVRLKLKRRSFVDQKVAVLPLVGE